MNRLFVDSDIIIDLLAPREYCADAAEFLTVIAERKAAGFTTPIVLANVDYIVTKYSTRAKSRKALRALRKSLSVLAIDEKIADNAIESGFTDFEDAIQYYSAEKNDIDFIVTRNKKDYSKGHIKAVTAREYLQMHYIDK